MLYVNLSWEVRYFVFNETMKRSQIHSLILKLSMKHFGFGFCISFVLLII